jgi:hypothetical protein
MKTGNKPEIFFHVGMGKAASTFLQYNVFPRFRNIHYIQRTQYRRAITIIRKGKYSRYLVSGELDNRLFKNYIREFASFFPETKTIIILRKHDSWIASQYKRYVKNGNPWSFNEFFDIGNDQGFWKQKDLYFFPLISILEKYFNYKPLVLFYDDLRADPEKFIRKIGDFIGADYDISRIDYSHKHSSYNEKQLKAIMAVSQCVNIRRKRKGDNKTLRVIRGLIPNLIRYSTLYVAIILPDSLFSKQDLIPPAFLEEIRKKYNADWEKCLEYAIKNNPLS